jgi:ribosomal protein S12 methylthiotransferase accessory factor YcaO
MALIGASSTHLGIVDGDQEGIFEFGPDTDAMKFLSWAMSTDSREGERSGDSRYGELLADFEDALDEFGLRIQVLRTRPQRLRAPFTHLLATERTADLRGRCIIAGTDALWVPSTADPESIRRVATRWLSQLEPALRLRIYASLRNAPGDFMALGDDPEPQFLQALKEEKKTGSRFRAFRFENQEAKLIGETFGSAAKGSLETSAPINQKSFLVGGEELFMAERRGACSNLEAQSIDSAGSPYDYSFGLGWTQEEAGIRAKSEAIERFALGAIEWSSLRRAVARDLPGPYLDPSTIAAYGGDQRDRLGLSRFDPLSTETWWIDGQLPNRSAVAAPAALVFMPFPPPGWLHHGLQTTSGTAAHPSAPSAAQSAWMELVERDAFLRAWWRREPLRPIVPPPRARALIGWLEDLGFTIRLLLLPGSFGIDAVGAFAFGRERLIVGAAAGAPSSASVKALTEVVAQLGAPAIPSVPHPSAVRSPADHAALWSGEASGARLEWLTATDIDPVVASDPSGFVAWRSIEDCPDPKAIFISLPSAVESEIKTVRVLSPSLVPLSFGYDSEPRGHACLKDFTWPQAPLRPHPFA